MKYVHVQVQAAFSQMPSCMCQVSDTLCTVIVLHQCTWQQMRETQSLPYIEHQVTSALSMSVASTGPTCILQ